MREEFTKEFELTDGSKTNIVFSNRFKSPDNNDRILLPETTRFFTKTIYQISDVDYSEDLIYDFKKFDPFTANLKTL